MNSKKYFKKTIKKTIINIKQIKTRKGKNQHYYFINSCNYDSTHYLDYKILAKYLNQLGCKHDNTMSLIEKHDKEQAKLKGIKYETFCKKAQYDILRLPKTLTQKIHADLFFYNINSNFLDKRLYLFKKYLANVLNIEFARITNKDVIYNNVSSVSSDIAREYLIKTFPINHFQEYKFPGWYILRPNDSFGGADIKYISSQKELNNAIEWYKTNKNFRGLIYSDNVSASKYLANLLLFSGKKMHLRMYYLVSCIDGVISSFLLDDGDIITADKPFNMDHPFTKAKHDTHVKSTGADLTIKKDFTTENIGISGIVDKWQQIYKKCQNICSGITKMIISKTNGNILFENQRNGYHIFGLDVFITKDLEPVLIECNEKPGFGTFTIKGNLVLSHNIYRWINSIILEPLLKYDKPMPMKAREHKTYINLD